MTRTKGKEFSEPIFATTSDAVGSNSPPPQHPAGQEKASVARAGDPESSVPVDGGEAVASGSSTLADTSFLKRALSKDNRLTARRFFSAYAQTWIGMSPLWLMGEALHPNKKVGTQFNKGRRNLMTAAEEVRQAVSTSGKDVVVIIDEKLKSSGEGGKQFVERTAEVIKAAGCVRF